VFSVHYVQQKVYKALQIYLELVCELDIFICANIFPQNQPVKFLVFLKIQCISYILENMITATSFPLHNKPKAAVHPGQYADGPQRRRRRICHFFLEFILTNFITDIFYNS
jgi:hypothetical protein